MVWPRGARPDAAAPLLAVVRRTFLPNRALAGAAEADVAALGALVPFIADKRALDGRATAYVCVRGRCELPCTSRTRWRRSSPRDANDPARAIASALAAIVVFATTSALAAETTTAAGGDASDAVQTVQIILKPRESRADLRRTLTRPHDTSPRGSLAGCTRRR